MLKCLMRGYIQTCGMPSVRSNIVQASVFTAQQNIGYGILQYSNTLYQPLQSDESLVLKATDSKIHAVIKTKILSKVSSSQASNDTNISQNSQISTNVLLSRDGHISLWNLMGIRDKPHRCVTIQFMILCIRLHWPI